MIYTSHTPDTLPLCWPSLGLDRGRSEIGCDGNSHSACSGEPVMGTAALHQSRTRLMGDQRVSTEFGDSGSGLPQDEKCWSSAVSKLPGLGHWDHKASGSLSPPRHKPGVVAILTALLHCLLQG